MEFQRSSLEGELSSTLSCGNSIPEGPPAPQYVLSPPCSMPASLLTHSPRIPNPQGDI